MSFELLSIRFQINNIGSGLAYKQHPLYRRTIRCTFWSPSYALTRFLSFRLLSVILTCLTYLAFTEFGTFYIVGFPTSASYFPNGLFTLSITLHSVLRYALSFFLRLPGLPFPHRRISKNFLSRRRVSNPRTFGLGSQRSTN